MGKRRLIKIYESRESNGIYLNRFANLDNARNGTYHELSCDPDKTGAHIQTDSPLAVMSDIVNACIYPIDASISYNDELRKNLQRNRIRFDHMTLFPEARNNDIRKKFATADRYQYVYMLPNSIYQYFDGLWMNESCVMVYYNAYDYHWPNLYSDETKAVGRYEVTLRLPPVPRRGTYELRYSLTANSNRGIAQVYFGNDLNNLHAAGIPLDLTVDTNDPNTGFESDTEDMDYNAEIDRRMRNKGYMKGDLSNCQNGNKAQASRYDSRILRHILLRETLDPDETYYLRLKSVLDSDKKELQLDYMEYCAKEIYDNPETPEDIW